MTVEAGKAIFVYNGDGINKVFPFPAPFYSASHMRVGVDGVEKFFGYTWSGAGSPAGGAVTFDVAPPAGTNNVVLLRDPKLEQAADFTNNSAVLGSTLETALDKIVMAQQRVDQSLDRAIHVRDIDAFLASESLQLPPVSVRKNKLLGFGGAGQVVVLDPLSTPVAFPPVGDLDVPGELQVFGNAEFFAGALGQTPLSTADDRQLATTEWVRARLAEFVPSTGGGGGGGSGIYLSSADFDLVGDGIADDSAAFQEFVDACAAQQKPGYLEPGVYKVNDIQVTQRVEIFGSTGIESYPADGGSWLYHTDTTKPCVKFSGEHARGSVFHNIAFKQDQNPVNTPAVLGSWSPKVYPATIQVYDCFGGVELRDLFFNGVYLGVDINNSGRTEIDGLFGQFIKGVMVIDKAYDACSVSNVHHWPYWSQAMAVYDWQHQNHVSIMLGRVDSASFDGKLFFYCGRFLFQFTNFGNGVATRIKVGQVQADAIPCGIYVSEGADEVSADFGVLDVQGQNIAIWNNGGVGAVLGAVAGLAAIEINARNPRFTIMTFRAELIGKGLLRCWDYPVGQPTKGAKGVQIRLCAVRGTSLNMDGGNAVWATGNTLTGTNGGYPQNLIYVALPLFLEGINSAPLTSGTGTLSVAGGGGGSGASDHLETGGVTVARVDAPTGVTASLLIRSTGTAIQLFAESPSANANIQLVPKGTGQILDGAGNPLGSGGGGGSASKLVSPDTTQEAEIKNTGGFFVTDISGAKAARFIADGNIDAGASGQWSLTGTTDLRNWLDKKFAAVTGGGGGGGDTLTSGSSTAKIIAGTGFRITDTYQCTIQGDGQILGRVFDNSLNGGLGGSGNLTSYIDARALKIFQANIGSANVAYASSAGSASSASTATNATYAGSLGSGTVYYSGGSLYIGSSTHQTDGNIYGGSWNSATNGGLGGNGFLSTYIEARASAFSDINLKIKSSIKPFRPGLDVVNAVEPKSFRYRRDASLPDGEHHYFIAQELEAVAPKLVRNHKGELHGDALVVDTKGMIAVLWNAVRELSAQNAALAERLDQLENQK